MIKKGLVFLVLCVAVLFIVYNFILGEDASDFVEVNNDNITALKDTIAYTSSSRMQKKINLIESDGSNDRVLWTSPQNLLISQSIGSLAWRPDGTELAFDSDHEFGMSLYGRDLYAVASDGSYIRKITNNPEIKHLKNFKKGSATIKSRNRLLTGTNFWAYIEGSLVNETWLAPTENEYIVTFEDVVDFGENISQQVVLGYIARDNRRLCFYDLAGMADIKEGEVIDIEQYFDTFSNKFQHCITVRQPSWSYNGEKILFTKISHVNPYRSGLSESNSEEYDIMMSNSENLAFANKGEQIGRFKFFSNDPKYIELSPTKEEDLLFVMHNNSADRIYISSATNQDIDQLDRIQRIDLGFCNYDDKVSYVDYKEDTCSVNDIEWISDGSGFFISMLITKYKHGERKREHFYRIYKHSLNTKKTQMVLDLKDEYIGDITLSASGEKVAFERSSRSDGPYDIWIYDKQNDNLKLLVKDGASPAWSR